MTVRQLDLGEAELSVLRALWDRGPSTVREVLAHLHERGRLVAYTTVQTLLTRLETKRFAVSDKSGLAFVYRAKVSRDRITKSRVGTLLTQLFDGEAAPLVLQLIKSEKFTPKEIQELQSLIEDLDTKS